MFRLILGVSLLWVICATAYAERLVLGHSVIYREATDDYEFRARFSFSVEDEQSHDVGLSFDVYGYREPTGILGTIGHVVDFAVRDAVPPITERYFPIPPQSVGSPLLDVDGQIVSLIVPRSQIQALGAVDVLFPYSIYAHTTERLPNGQFLLEYQDGVPNPRMTQLNVPEPSTLALAGAVLLSVMAARYRTARRRFGSS